MSRARQRLARNVREGMQVQVLDTGTGVAAWLRVTSALHVTAPVALVILTLEDGDEFTLRPSQTVAAA